MKKSFKIGFLSILMLLISVKSLATVYVSTEEELGLKVAVSSGQLEEMENTKIYIDGVLFKTDKPFYNIKGSILVPMKPIFEKLEADIRWEPLTKTVIANTKDRTIELTIDNKLAKVNNENKNLAVEPKLIKATTYVPLRFVAEALVYDVDWDSKNNIISIINTNFINESNGTKIYKTSNAYDKEFMNMEIIDNEKIKISGKIESQKDKWLLKIEGKTYDYSDLIFSNDVDENGNYELLYKFKSNFKEGEYEITISFKEPGDKTYWSYYQDIPLSYENGEVYFSKAPMYKNNYVQYIKNSALDPSEFLDIKIGDEEEKNEIKSLALKITKDSTNDYDRLIKINDWVAENIYYNWDGYLSGNYGRTDAYGTLKAKKSVCQGYSELTDALLKSVDIPSRLVTGHALGVSASGKSWDRVDHSKSNHAWNEAYVDGRWVILDTTWNSKNKYEEGQFNKGAISHRYFDPTLEVFSYDHKIMMIE